MSKNTLCDLAHNHNRLLQLFKRVKNFPSHTGLQSFIYQKHRQLYKAFTLFSTLFSLWRKPGDGERALSKMWQSWNYLAIKFTELSASSQHSWLLCCKPLKSNRTIWKIDLAMQNLKLYSAKNKMTTWCSVDSLQPLNF